MHRGRLVGGHARWAASRLPLVALTGSIVSALVFAATPARAETFGSPLRAPNYPYDCTSVYTPGLGVIPFAGATSCIWGDVPAPTEAVAGQNVSFAPSIVGTGTVTQARIQVGTSTGPMRLVVMRSLYENTITPGRPNDACCIPVAQSQTFTPAPDAITTVPLDLPMREDPTPAETDITTIADFDTLTLAVLSTGVQVPLYATGDTYLGSPAPADFYWDTASPSTITPGFSTDSGGWAVDLNADFTPAGTATGGPPPPAPVTAPTPAPTPGATSPPSPTVVPVLNLTPNGVVPVRAGGADLPVTCATAALCAGRLLLRNAPLPGARIARQTKHKRVLTYGSASFMVAGRSSRTLAVPLSTAGKALFTKRRHAAVVWADVQLAAGGAPSSMRITLRRQSANGASRRAGFREIEAPVSADQPKERVEMPLPAMWRPLHGDVTWPSGRVDVRGLPF